MESYTSQQSYLASDHRPVGATLVVDLNVGHLSVLLRFLSLSKVVLLFFHHFTGLERSDGFKLIQSERTVENCQKSFVLVLHLKSKLFLPKIVTACNCFFLIGFYFINGGPHLMEVRSYESTLVWK